MAGGQSFPSPGWSTLGIAVYSMRMCASPEGRLFLPPSLCLVSLFSPSLAPLLESQVPWGRTQSCSSLALWWPNQDGSKVAPPSLLLSTTNCFHFLECELDASLASRTCKEMRGERPAPPHLTPIGVGCLRAQQELSPKKFLHKPSLHPTAEVGAKPQGA